MEPEDIIAAFLLKQRELIAIIDRVPYVPSTIRNLKLTTQKNVRTTEVRIQNRSGHLSLIPTSERGAPVPKDVQTGSNIKVFPTMRLIKSATLHSHELQDVVMFGEGNVLQRVSTELASRFAGIENDMILTEENMQLGMIQGRIPDADGSILIDYFTEWGIEEAAPVAFNFNTDTLKTLRLKCKGIRRTMRKALRGIAWGGQIGAIMGSGAHDSLTTSPALEQLYMGWAAAMELKDASVFKPFNFGNINWMEYEPTDDESLVAVPDGVIRFFPIGANGMFIDVRAPGENLNRVNQVGRLRFPSTFKDPKERFIEAELGTYPQFVVTAPGALLPGTAA